MKVLFSMFPTLDFLGSVLHKNWLEKDLLLNKESDIPTATICIINRKPFLSFSVRSSVLQQSHSSSFVVQVTQSPIEFIPIMKNIIFSFGDDGSTFGPIQGKNIVTQDYPAIGFTDQSSDSIFIIFKTLTVCELLRGSRHARLMSVFCIIWKTQLFS